MKVLTVVGARPQFIKAAVVSRALRPDHDECLVHTGQHYDRSLSSAIIDDVAMPTPDHHLGIGSAPHGVQTASIMSSLEPILEEEQPDAVVAYGDTNSTVAAALVAAKLPVCLAHVEAGLRSHDRTMPEEINRILTDHAADLLLAPTATAMGHLDREGIADRAIRTGDVMYDALLWAMERTPDPAAVIGDWISPDEPFLLLTVHRAANTDDPARLRSIVDAVVSRPEPVVFPVHPRTRAALDSAGLLERLSQSITVIDPVPYLDFLSLLDAADRVLTDSGGVQKEAYLVETPCVTLRDRTEWPETAELGWNRLVGADIDRIHRAIEAPRPSPDAQNPFGDGSAATKVVSAIETAVGRTTIDAHAW